MSKIIISAFFILSIVIALLIENTLITVPLVYLISAFFLVFVRKVRVYIGVFLSALIIDSLRVTYFGYTPFFLIGLLIIIFLYERYSGSDDVFVSSFLIAVSALIYANTLSYSVFYTTIIIVSAATGWYGFNLLQKKGGNFS